MYLQPQNNHRPWLNGSETALDFLPGLLLSGPATELHLPVIFPTADASFPNLSEKAVTHKQEQISLACRKGKLLAEINLQRLQFHRKELVGGAGLIYCPVPPASSPLLSVPFSFLPLQASPGPEGASLGPMLDGARRWALSLRMNPLGCLSSYCTLSLHQVSTCLFPNPPQPPWEVTEQIRKLSHGRGSHSPTLTRPLVADQRSSRPCYWPHFPLPLDLPSSPSLSSSPTHPSLPPRLPSTPLLESSLPPPPPCSLHTEHPEENVFFQRKQM